MIHSRSSADAGSGNAYVKLGDRAADRPGMGDMKPRASEGSQETSRQVLGNPDHSHAVAAGRAEQTHLRCLRSNDRRARDAASRQLTGRRNLMLATIAVVARAAVFHPSRDVRETAVHTMLEIDARKSLVDRLVDAAPTTSRHHVNMYVSSLIAGAADVRWPACGVWLEPHRDEEGWHWLGHGGAIAVAESGVVSIQGLPVQRGRAAIVELGAGSPAAVAALVDGGTLQARLPVNRQAELVVIAQARDHPPQKRSG